VAHDTLVSAVRVGEVAARLKVAPPDEDDMAFDSDHRKKVRAKDWESSPQKVPRRHPTLLGGRAAACVGQVAAFKCSPCGYCEELKEGNKVSSEHCNRC
jgi:hypothetical protein